MMKIKEKLKNKVGSEKARELLVNSFWSILGSIISKGLVFLAWILVGRILGKEDYGSFGIIRNTVIMFTSFAGLGLGLTASKFVAEFLHSDKAKVERILGLTLAFGTIMGAIIGVFTLIFSSYLAKDMLHAPALVFDLQIASIILFFSSLNGAQIGALQGLQAFKKLASINTWQAICSFPLFIVGAYYGGVRGSVEAFAFYNIIICVFSYFAIRTESKKLGIRINYKDALLEKRIILTYSLPAFLSGLMITPLKWLSDVMLVNTPNGFQSMGIFTAALTFNSIFMMLTSMLDAPFLTLMSKNKNDSTDSNFNRFNIIAPWAIGIFLILPFLVFPETGAMLFGKDYEGSEFKWTFIFILLFTLLIMYKQGLSRILAVYNMQWYAVLSNLIWGLTLLVSFYYLKIYGTVGLGGSYTIAYFVCAVAMLPFYFKKKLIPRHTIFSPYAVLLWLFIAALTAMNLFSVSVIMRLMVLGLSFVLLFFILRTYILDKKL